MLHDRKRNPGIENFVLKRSSRSLNPVFWGFGIGIFLDKQLTKAHGKKGPVDLKLSLPKSIYLDQGFWDRLSQLEIPLW